MKWAVQDFLKGFLTRFMARLMTGFMKVLALTLVLFIQGTASVFAVTSAPQAQQPMSSSSANTTDALSPELETRARALGLELRCPVCQGLSISESPSEFARAMYAELRNQVAGGRNDEEIREYFVSRYGEDVLLNPPKSGLNLIIWLAPVLMVVCGGVAVTMYLRRASLREPQANPRDLERVRAALRSMSADDTRSTKDLERNR